MVTHEWTSTKQAADYLGVSRAQVTQHLKLLEKPAGMAREIYDKAIDKLKNGTMGAEAAFELLTRVEPTRAQEVMEKVEEQAKAAAAEAVAVETAVADVPKPAKPSASGIASTDRRHNNPGRPKGSKNGERAIGGRASISHGGERSENNTKQVKEIVTARQIRQTAREIGAAKRDQLQAGDTRSLQQVKQLILALTDAKYPDTLRAAGQMFGRWWVAEAQNTEVMQRWDRLAVLVKAGERVTR